MGIARPCGVGYVGSIIQGYSYDELKRTVFISLHCVSYYFITC